MLAVMRKWKSLTADDVLDMPLPRLFWLLSAEHAHE